MAFQRRDEVGAAVRPSGASCSEVRSRLAAFFDWCGCSNGRARARWDTIATRRVLDGVPVETVLAQAKEAWYAHRKRVGLPMRAEQCGPEAGHAMFGAVMEIMRDHLNPAQAAVVFRSIEREFPGEAAPRLTAAHCARLGGDWRNDEDGFSTVGEW